MAKSTLTKITAYANAFTAKSYNKRIIYTTQEDGNILVECIRFLSKEEQELLKDSAFGVSIAWHGLFRGRSFAKRLFHLQDMGSPDGKLLCRKPSGTFLPLCKNNQLGGA